MVSDACVKSYTSGEYSPEIYSLYVSMSILSSAMSVAHLKHSVSIRPLKYRSLFGGIKCVRPVLQALRVPYSVHLICYTPDTLVQLSYSTRAHSSEVLSRFTLLLSRVFFQTFHGFLYIYLALVFTCKCAPPHVTRPT